MAASSAKKVAAFRERQKNHLLVLRATVPEMTTEALVAAGWLDRDKSGDKASVEAALSAMLVDWVSGWMDFKL